MTYTLNVQTNYHVPINFNDYTHNTGSSIHRNMPAKFPKLGNFRLVIPGAGEVNFIDIAQKHIANFSKATWGILISYQGQECEFRYEGEGDLTVNVTELGQIELSGSGSYVLTDLPSFILK